MSRTASLALAIVLGILLFVFLPTLNGLPPLVSPGADGDSTTVQSPSGLEYIDNELTNLRGCTDNQVLTWTEADDKWLCAYSPQVVAALPLAPVEGELYYDNVAHKLKVWTGAAWETVTSAP